MTPEKSVKRQKFIIAGLGNRGLDTFARALLGFPNYGIPEFRERSEIAAFVDINIERAKAANAELGVSIPVYRTIPEAAARHPADWAVIATVDRTHADLAVAALDQGLDVFVDKPMATSVWECNRIIDAGRRSGRRVVVGHNLRYYEDMLALAKLVRSGAIGEVRQIEAGEVLDYTHGGSYFNRWHSEFDKSAGLMNHKCCHQLDEINWAIDDSPVMVSAMGARDYYAPRPALKTGTRCSECAIAKQCRHFCDLDADDGRLRRMYADVEHVDGYIRDRCVFSDRNTINDRETLNIRYSRGATACFSMIAYAPREYNYYNFTGHEGRLEYSVVYDRTANAGKSQIRLFHRDGRLEFIDVDSLFEGYGHGGADVRLIADLLGMDLPGADPIQRATPEQARNAVAIADMAARSIAGNGRCVAVEETGRDFPPPPPRAGRAS